MTKFKKIILTFAVFALIPLLAVCGCNTDKAAFNWVRSKIDMYYYKDLPDGCVYNGSVKQYVEDYLDRYSAFYTKEEYEAVVASSAGQMSGLGVSFQYVKQGEHPSGKSGVHLARVVGNSPAYRAGLRAGEFVISGSCDGSSVTFTSLDSFSGFLDGIPTGKSFTLTTDRDSYEVSKQAYTASYCYMATNSCEWNVTYTNGGLTVVEEEGGKSCLPDGAAYLSLDQFYGNAADEMAALIEKFNANNCTSLILDLRQNGGGYVNVMSDISSIYTGQLPNPCSSTGYAEYKNGGKEYFTTDKKYSSSQQLPKGVQVKVLADNGTASASEALIGVLISNGVMDYSDVYVSDFGEEYLAYSKTADKDCRTYGKGIMQTTYQHPVYHYAIKLTTARIYWPDGTTCIHDKGVGKADGCKTVSASWSVTYDDEQLKLAADRIYGGTDA